MYRNTLDLISHVTLRRHRRFVECSMLLLASVAAGQSAYAGAAAAIAITSSPQTDTVGACSSVVKIQAQDSKGNAASVSSNTTVSLAGSSTSLAFFTDSACSQSANGALVIKFGSSSTKFYFTGSAAGSVLINLSASAYGGAHQNETIKAPSAGGGGGSTARPIPAPIVGVTLDDVSNVSGEVTSLSQLARFPTSRIVFDYSEQPSYYSGPIQKLRGVSYIMGEIADSSDMSKFTAASYQTRAQSYVSALGGTVDLWEIGNEVNGNWLGGNMMSKLQGAYDAVSAAQGATAITFFYEGEPSDSNNCISTNNGGNDMFTWINTNFELAQSAGQRSAETEKIRLGTDYILISWYPQQCNNIQPDWTTIFSRLATIFPNAKLGFGEIGTANPQSGSQYEVNLIRQFYGLAGATSPPPSYVGGYFWWYYAEEMVPTNATQLFNILNQTIQSTP